MNKKKFLLIFAVSLFCVGTVPTIGQAATEQQTKLEGEGVVQSDGQEGNVKINSFYIGMDSYLRGTYKGDMTQIRLKKTNRTTNTVTWGQRISIIDSKVRFNYYAKKFINNTSDKIEFLGYNDAGKLICSQVVTVGKTKGGAKDKLLLQPYTVLSSYLTGSASGAVSYCKLEVNGQLDSSSVTPNIDGIFKYYVGNKVKGKLNDVYLNGYDAQKKLITRTKVTVVGDLFGDFVLDYDNIRGTYRGGVAYVQAEVIHQFEGIFLMGPEVAVSKQEIAYDVKNYDIGRPMTEVYMYAFDKDGNLLDCTRAYDTNYSLE
ncbi:immunoglobulin-like domain-containing protein [Listeria newyorkensis]|uniref:Bacterial Ig domain-containing protein n=1 Tax=Listeria newyorkensis TaxID=1497681 RepID=A0A841YTS8_9LIST|nr:immunoglobulin-like domain-containing protein [Listeria newyorkensis]MBC1456658.1 hypothetical protein [Listeria newyorkensis]